MTWEKEKRMADLEGKMKEGVVDGDIASLLTFINSFEGMYTLSSCSGRICLIELPDIGDKKHAIFHGKWHRPTTFDEVMEAVRSYQESGSTDTYLYLLTQSPIFHINIRNVTLATTMFQLARNCGFKHSAFKSISQPFLLEVLSTERVDIPIGFNRQIMVDEEVLRFFALRCNHALERSKKKLGKLETKLGTLR